MKASDVIRRVGVALNDETHVRWKQRELVDYVNEAQRQVVLVRPDANSITASVALVAGSKQAIPSGGIRFLRATRNMGSDGLTPGRAIREGSRVVLDAEFPDWHITTGSTVEGFVFDNVSPKTFYVYPAVLAAGTYIELAYSGLPAEVLADGTTGAPTTGTDTLTLQDQYMPPIIDYVLSRCFEKDSEDAGNAQRAASHMTAFATALTVPKAIGSKASSAQLSTPTPSAPRMAA